MNAREYFPDGTVIDEWFYDTTVPGLDELGRQYVLTKYHIFDDTMHARSMVKYPEVFTKVITDFVKEAEEKVGLE